MTWVCAAQAYASQVPHATKIGRYEWTTVTGNRMYREGFSLGNTFTEKRSLRNRIYGHANTGFHCFHD